MRRGLAAVLLCLLVASAGCSVIPGGSDGDDGTTAEEVPGVEDGRLANESALLDAHIEATTETGYSYERRANVTDAVGGEPINVSERQRTRVEAGASEYWIQQITTAAGSSRVTAWGNESLELRRIERPGQDPQVRVGESRPPGELAARAVFEPRLSPEFEVVDVEQREDAPDIVTLEVDGMPEENEVFAGQENVENVRGFEAQLVVDTEGRIHSYAAAAVYDIEGETANYDFSYQMTSFEDPGVERPEWAAEGDG